MANPPANRRPGVDADIFQGQWVRGFDVPAGNDDPAADPCDLIVSNGKSQIDQSVSNLIFASRIDDIGQPIFVMAQGADPTAPIGTVNFHIGREEDPNGLISGVGPGSLYASYGIPGLWQLQDDDITWVKISDDLGGEDLQQTLAIGNFTGGFDIVMTSGDSIVGADNALGVDGAPVQLQGGAATGVAGNGGQIIARGGDSTNGTTGGVEISTLATTTGAQSGTGSIALFTGDSRFGGNSGGLTLSTGDAGDPTISGNSGSMTLRTGRNFNTGGINGAGRLDLIAGQATQDGQGGSVRLFAGAATSSTQNIPIPFFVSGMGGNVELTAAESSGTNQGGSVILSAGEGGSGGAPGGNILLNVGPGGGGSSDGLVISDGVLIADNIKRGTQDPNSINLAGNEGDVYQRTAGGLGQVWVNTNGSSTGWQQLAFAGDFVEAYQQMTTGYVSPSMYEFGGTDEEKYSDIGLYKGLRVVEANLADVVQSVNGTGPALTVQCNETSNNNQAALDMITNGNSGQGVSLQNRFFATFVVQTASTDDDACRFFLGLSNNDVTTQLSSDLPGGRYIGFVRSAINGNWVVVHRGSGGANFVNTGVSKTITDGGTSDDSYYFVIDATDGPLPVVRFFILDPDLQVLANVSVPTNIPSSTEELWPAWGVRSVNTSGGGFVSALRINSAAITTKAGTVAQGGGTGTGGLSLSQVLVNGNTTGSTLIEINHGSGINGVLDDNAGDGATVGVASGGTSLATNSTGPLILGSASTIGPGATNAGQTTGAVTMASGLQLSITSQGDTGDVTIFSGDHGGTDGKTGDLILRSGGFTNGAAGTREQGDVFIAPASFLPNPATVTGEVIIKGGSSTLSGIVGGDVSIFSGENSSPVGDTGNIFIETFDVNIDGDSGDIEVATGDAGSTNGNSGILTLQTGASPAGDSGFAGLGTGHALAGTAGPVTIVAGNSGVSDGADIQMFAGDTTDAAGTGGNIEMTPGTGPLGDGAVIINGKLTVTGLIDPTGLQLTGQAVTPVPGPPAGDGVIWVDNTVVPSRLFFTDDTGTSTDISMGGGATSLGALTDVNLVAPAVGEVLTYNGAEWTNLPGVGGSPLATILGLGNTTGGTAGGITVSDSLGDRIVSDGNLRLDPSVTPGDAVVIDGLRWPEADGPAGFVLTTNGLGQLSFQPGGGGGGGSSFAEAFAQMQWGTLMPPADAGNLLNGSGILDDHLDSAPGGNTVLPSNDGYVVQMLGVAPNVAPARFVSANPMTRPDNLGLYLWKFEISNTAGVRLFLGLTSDPSADTFMTSDAPAGALSGYVGLGYSTTVPDAGFVFWHSNVAGAGTRVATGVAPVAGNAYYFALDLSVPGQATCTIYDQDFVALSAVAPIVATLPASTTSLDVMGGLMPTGGVNEALSLYSCTVVHRADLLNVLGGGGSQDLASVLGFGNSTGGLTIKGEDNNVGVGGVLSLAGGDSTGGGGAGGPVDITTGAPDPGGNGAGGDFQVNTSTGAGLGDGGTVQLSGGDGGPLGGDGGSFRFDGGGGPGAAAGAGGSAAFNLGDGGGTGGVGGSFLVVGGSALAGNSQGGEILLDAGNGFGTGAGGALTFLAGDGGANGDGGDLVLTAGTGNGAGIDGEIFLNGDTTIDGKLTVTGLIDPTGLLLESQAILPFTPLGSDGGIWVNNSGELIYSNSGGDLNLSTAIGGGPTFLDALLTAGYGFLGPGNTLAGPQSYGVFGSSVNAAVSPGPPPASATIGQDSEGPFLNLAVAATAGSEAFLSTTDLQIQRDSQFKSRFKFQVTSPAHTDERLFIGFTDDATTSTPNPMLAVDTPVPGVQYMGLAQTNGGFNLEFVAQGSGGAMVNQFALPTDALVHYFEIDTTDATQVTFTVYAADGETVEATWTEPDSFLLPDLANPLRPFLGIHTDTGTTPRSLDIYQVTVVTRADVVDAVTGGGGGGNPDLETVLTSGNTTGANGIEFSLGATGISTEAAAPNSGSAGQLLTMVLGAGSTETGTAVAGGSGGLFSFIGGAGGATDAAAANGGVGGGWFTTLGSGGANTAGSNGGDGGSYAMVAGSGGNATGGTGNGGDGGDFRLFTGAGGNSTSDTGGDGGDVRIDLSTGAGGAGDLQGGNAGSFLVVGGDGGASASGTGGNGTDLIFTAGLPGAGGVVNGNGGRIEFYAGDSLAPSGDPGGITLYAGDAVALPGSEGSVQLASAAFAGDGFTESFLVVQRALSNAGGPITMVAGRAPVGSGGNGGDIVLGAREGDGIGEDGSIHLLASGASPVTGIGGGDIQMVGAETTGVGTGGRFLAAKAIGGLPGAAQVAGGDAEAASGLQGGFAGVQGGAGDGVGDGGRAFIAGGTGGATGDGGDAQVLGGTATGGANTGGNVRLQPGPGPAGDGAIQIAGKIDPALGGGQAGVQYGVFTVPAPGGSVVVPFNTPFGTTPTTITFNLGSFSATAGGRDIVITAITATDFTLNSAPSFAVGEQVHWVAFA